MKSLTIRLLGKPGVFLDGEPVSFRTRKVLALLVFLAVEREMHSRESLMALLWPERPPENAAASLRVTLSHLRKVLNPAGGGLITKAGRVGLDATFRPDLDIDHLAAAARPDVRLEALIPVLKIDRGEFLEDFSLPDAPAFDRWAAVRREACRRQLEAVYDRLSHQQLSSHDNAAAETTAARWAARAPLNEQACRRLMSAQALNGRRTKALLAFKHLREALKRDLDLEPAQETALLAENIRLGRIGPERDGPAFHERSPANIRRPRLILPLVGRGGEHQRLLEAYEQVGRDKTGVMILIGAAGIGKTRLVNAFRDSVLLERPETEVWQGRAFETGGRLAYQPVVEALRRRLDQVNAPEDLLEDAWLAELSQLMPELRARYPDLSLPLTGDTNFVRARLFEALAVLGVALAAGRPAIMTLDDLQWADADTLDLVHYLVRRWAEMKVSILLLLTVRREAYAAEAPLRNWISRMERDGPSTRMFVEGLDAKEVGDLVGRLAAEGPGETAASDFAAWLWAETRGLPFFIEAILNMLLEQGVLAMDDEPGTVHGFSAALDHVRSLAKTPIPPGVREVIRARLEGQSRAGAALLLAAAVMGRACTFGRLCRVADVQEIEALGAIEGLLHGGLFVERPSERRPYLPAHDYIREVVYSESSEASRRVFHRRALIAAEAAGDPPAECAFHALASQLDEPAFRFSVVAGSEALSAYALQDALPHFETARETAGRMQDHGERVDAKLLARLYLERGQALEFIQDDETAQANYEAMRAIGVHSANRSMELAALLRLGGLHANYTSVFNPILAKEIAGEALALACELEDRAAEAGALWCLMFVEFTSAGDNDLILDYGQRALALARELGLSELIGRTLSNLCFAFVVQRQLTQAREAVVEAQHIWTALGNLPRLAEAHRYLANIHNVVGDYKQLLEESARLIELGGSIGSRLDEMQGLIFSAIAYGRQGWFENGQDCIERAGTLASAIGHLNEKHDHLWGRIELYLSAGAFEKAERLADSLYAEREVIMPAFYLGYLAAIARVKTACGKWEEAQAILDELAPRLQTDGLESLATTTIAVAFGHLRLAQGLPETLFTGLEDRLRPMREAGFQFLLADEHWLRGRAALALGQHDRARDELLKGRDAAEAQDERVILWRILSALSHVDRAAGDSAAADRLRERARAVVQDIADHAGELRGAFIAQPEAAKLLDEA